MAMEFKITVGGRSKDILRITELLAECGVNLVTVSTEKINDSMLVRLLTADDESCTHCLMKADLHYEARPVLIVEVDDQPGQWSRIARRLADAGLEIEASYLLSRDGERMEFVFAVDDPQKGEQIIREFERE